MSDRIHAAKVEWATCLTPPGWLSLPRMRTLLNLPTRPSLRIIMAENNRILVTNKVEGGKLTGENMFSRAAQHNNFTIKFTL